MLLSKLLSGTPRVQEDPNESPRADYAPRHGYSTKSKERVTVAGAQSIATAYRAKNIISDDVAKMPFQQVRRTGQNIEQVQPDAQIRNMAYLLQVSPNLWGWTPFQFKKATIEWLLFYGNAYIWSPPIGPRQLLILPADRTIPLFDTDGNLWYQHTFTNGRKEFIPSVEILHLLINADETGFIGRGVISFARETFGLRLAARNTQSMLYSQGVMPAAYIQANSDLNQEMREKIRSSYEEAMSGQENAYRLAILDKKITKFEAINLQLRDAQFLESIDATDRDICNFFGLAEHMLNRGKQAYNSNDQKYLEYLQGTLDAYLVPWEEAARISWLPMSEQPYTYFKFVRESLLRMDAEKRARTNQIKISSGQMQPNEAREKDDLGPYPEGNRFYMAGNILPIGGEKTNGQNP